jgi:hypothetical protein
MASLTLMTYDLWNVITNCAREWKTLQYKLRLSCAQSFRQCFSAWAHVFLLKSDYSVYMESLKLQDNYISLKSRYLEQQARAFPSLGKKKDDNNDQADSIDKIDGEKGDEEVLPVSPVEERDNQISVMQKDLDDLQMQLKEMDNLKESLAKSQTENSEIKKVSSQLTMKLNLTRKANEIS